MLRSLSVQGFKSLKDVRNLELAQLTVFFGPNASGKSNLLDALLLLSRLATARTLAEAIEEPVRGWPLELFTFPPGGHPELVKQEEARFRLEAHILPRSSGDMFQYACEIAIKPDSGSLTVQDELLARLTSRGKPRGNPVIEKRDGAIFIRRKGKGAHPWKERVGLNHTVLSNRRYSGEGYETIEKARNELSSYRSYYLDPRVAMRTPQPPREVDDIGTSGGNLAPFLYRLRADAPQVFRAVRRTLCALIPSVEDLVVDMDEKRGIVNIEIRQNGTPFSARVISEGTLRVLALVSVALNPWGGSLVAFEEPENGVHPRRLELITELFRSMALDESERRRQVILTTHSPTFCESIVRLAKAEPGKVKLFRTMRSGSQTIFQEFDTTGPLFESQDIRKALAAPGEDGLFEALMIRGLLDG
jgi:predicted ATPase